MAEQKAGFPNQIKFIVGNEAAERFSYYGMRSILVVFMVNYLDFGDNYAKGVYHAFLWAAYFTPLFGGYLSDRFLGKYRTIILLSLVYCLGHLVLAIWENATGMYAGLFLIALGAGGIKPCVSAHVGDQFDRSNEHLLKKVFDLFYWSINFGSFFSTLLIPWVLPKYGPGWAFGIPGILMFLATVVFWMGRDQYVHVPPTGKEGQSHFFGIVFSSLLRLGRNKGAHFLDAAKEKYDAQRVEGAKAAWSIGGVFVSVAAFWSLYDQMSSAWILQAEQMDLNVSFLGFSQEFRAAQIHALNPMLVMLLIPIFSLWLYPLVERMGVKLTALRKMGFGLFLTALAFVLSAAIQWGLDSGLYLNVSWQFFPYLVITAAEIMVSVTGLEFAYTQAPRSMKSTIMSLWYLMIAMGNLFTSLISFFQAWSGWKFSGAAEYVFYAVLMFLVALGFVWISRQYKERNYIEEAGAWS